MGPFPPPPPNPLPFLLTCTDGPLVPQRSVDSALQSWVLSLLRRHVTLVAGSLSDPSFTRMLCDGVLLARHGQERAAIGAGLLNLCRAMPELADAVGVAKEKKHG